MRIEWELADIAPTVRTRVAVAALLQTSRNNGSRLCATGLISQSPHIRLMPRPSTGKKKPRQCQGFQMIGVPTG
ncbi:hypothetical protein, partial [Xanthomonas vasicola]|uniref:hypothetical protein n=2 Tax=Xanthomonas vasicola TaxID=56459 RepID=UPI001F4692B5